MTQERTPMKLPVILAACLLAASTVSFAQAPQGDAAKAPRKARFDCSQAKDPKACEGKEGAERRDCMRRELCAQSKDPAACEAKAKEARQKIDAERARIRAACKGKEGDELRACVREQRASKK